MHEMRLEKIDYLLQLTEARHLQAMHKITLVLCFLVQDQVWLIVIGGDTFVASGTLFRLRSNNSSIW